MHSVRRAAAGAAGLAFLLSLIGCSSERDQQARDMAAANKSNAQRLANIYAAYQNAKGGKGPKDEAELKAFIKEYDPFKVQSMGFDPGNVDKAFTSERDGAAFKIRYGVGGGRGSVDAVVFESAGKDGKKQVGYTGGKVEDVDDATYKALWSGKKPAGASVATGAADPKGVGRPVGPPAGAPKGPVVGK
jgi:hypothetical protein